MSDRPIRVAVVDDEVLGRRRVEDLLRKEPGIEIVGSFGDGQSALEGIRELEPDLVFLDVQMPRMSGTEVVRAMGDDMPPTIFVTAYDKHAVAAFELAAVDYLVKPFDDERFEQAIQRARRLHDLEETRRVHERLLRVLHEGDAPSAPPPPANESRPTYLDRIPVESKGQVRFVPVDDIDCIVASGVYAELVTGDRRYLIRESMNDLEERLDPRQFLRIHRSSIVALDRVDALLRGAGGDYEVRLKSGARLKVARSRRSDLEARLGMKT